MNDQWMGVTESTPIGKAILACKGQFKLVYHNPALAEMAQKVMGAAFDPLRAKESIEDILRHVTVKVVSKHGAGVASVVTFAEFLAIHIDDVGKTGKRASYFLDQINTLIEIHANKVTFEGEKVKLVSFIDCTSAQRLEKVQTESKYKTSLIATISHELRTPISAVLGTLEVIKKYVPAESMKYVDIATESCNMITFHVNDLTVLSPLVKLWDRTTGSCPEQTCSWSGGITHSRT